MQTSFTKKCALRELAEIQILIRNSHFFISPRFTEQINHQHSYLVIDLGSAMERLGVVMNHVYQNLGLENSTCIKRDLFARVLNFSKQVFLLSMTMEGMIR